MRTIEGTEKVTVTVKTSELFEGKWLSYTVLSKKLLDKEKEGNMNYKTLRSRLYNTEHAGKLHTEEKAGMKFINIENPMKTANASLVLSFLVEE